MSLFVLPGAALAQGGAAGDQYSEQVPNATGDSGSGGDGSGDLSGSTSNSSGADTDSTGGGGGSSSGGSGGGGGGGPLNAATVDKFDKGGADGQAAANLAGKTAPDSAALNNAAQQAQLGSTGESTSVFDEPSQSSNSDDGMGIALPIILGIVLLGGLGYAWTRRNGRIASGSTDPRVKASLRERLRSYLPERG